MRLFGSIRERPPKGDKTAVRKKGEQVVRQSITNPRTKRVENRASGPVNNNINLLSAGVTLGLCASVPHRRESRLPSSSYTRDQTLSLSLFLFAAMSSLAATSYFHHLEGCFTNHIAVLIQHTHLRRNPQRKLLRGFEDSPIYLTIHIEFRLGRSFNDNESDFHSNYP